MPVLFAAERRKSVGSPARIEREDGYA